MNEASRIVADLQRKLAELDHKVWTYRREMASEFEKYSDDLLRNVPDHVSDTVTQTLAQSMNGYRSLNPDGVPMIKSFISAHSNDISRKILTLPQPIDRQVGSFDSETNLRSPHEHEKEFEGVFTPSYLPLLDGSSDERRTRSLEPSITLRTTRGCGRENRIEEVDASTEILKSQVVVPASKPMTPERRNTDEFSTNSDCSDTGTPRRSALRPSSSSSRGGGQSPRRVRFNVAGEEVLPTASPMPTAQLLHDGLSLVTFDSDDDEDGNKSEDENENEDVEIFEDIDEPPPKRISSSQALRLLSRRSLEDDGTVWTAVYAPEDGSPSVAIAETVKSPTTIDKNECQQRENRSESNSRPTSTPPLSDKQGNVAENHRSKITRLHPRDSQTPDMTSSLSSENNENRATINHDVQELRFKDDDEEELFEFDELTLLPKHNRSPVTCIEESDQDDDDDDDDFLTIKANKFKTQLSSRTSQSQSLALDIPEKSPILIESPRSSNPDYSHRTHPFSTPIVNPEVHAQAASLGALNTFVGSLDGRTGFDENKINDLSVGSAEKGLIGSLKAGRSPKSLTERMLLEDLIEEELSRTGDNSYSESATIGERYGEHMVASFNFGRSTSKEESTKVRYLK